MRSLRIRKSRIQKKQSLNFSSPQEFGHPPRRSCRLVRRCELRDERSPCAGGPESTWQRRGDFLAVAPAAE
eukprot:6237728-Pyramimonas_sp.AAC.1